MIESGPYGLNSGVSQPWSMVQRTVTMWSVMIFCARAAAPFHSGTERGDCVRLIVKEEASKGASLPVWALLLGAACLMPASVSFEAVAVIGVVVPEDSGVANAGAIAVGIEDRTT